MKTIIFILILAGTIQAQNTSNTKLPKYKAQFYTNNYDMAWYTYVKWNVPVLYTLAMAAHKTNYGRNGRYKVGDVFGTGKKYKYTNAWDEFGLMMKTTYNNPTLSRKDAIKISKKTEELCNTF
jgi:hypothetical protein